MQNSRFFLKPSKEIGKAWRKSLTPANRASLPRGEEAVNLLRGGGGWITVEVLGIRVELRMKEKKIE